MHTRHPKQTGLALGSGVYGSVVELELDGERVAGKVFKWSRSVMSEVQRRKLRDEIRMVLHLRHPNIVASKGVCFLPNIVLPVLLMEKLMTTLQDYILAPENSMLLLQTKFSILHDTASGLHYLHNYKPAIIHRDLTPRNVLLDSEMTAKVSDFGNAVIVEMGETTTERMQSQSRPQIDTSIDILSFGYLALFTVLQKHVQHRPPTYKDSTEKQVHRSEEERREKYVTEAEQRLSDHQTVFVMIKKCLNAPPNHPHTDELLRTLAPFTPSEFGFLFHYNYTISILGKWEQPHWLSHMHCS